MAKFLKKGSLGMLLEASGGASDPELAEVRLSPDEYFDLLLRIKHAKQAELKAKEDAEERERDAYIKARRKLEICKAEIQSDADKKIESVNRALQEAEKLASKAESKNKWLEDALSRQKSLNENLKRIARERANAKRGLIPKKDRCGYIVLYSSQYRQRYRDSDRQKRVSIAWMSVLQTPYDATLPLDQIKDDIWDELMNEVLYSLGVRRVQDVEHNGEYITWQENSEKLCGVYRWDFRANYKTGFWEITLYHTKSLCVPEEYRPAT